MDHMSPFSRARHVNNLPYYLRGLIYLLMLCCNWDMDQVSSTHTISLTRRR